nr:hypothetical protein CFP56_16463 [Quercus suber]
MMELKLHRNRRPYKAYDASSSTHLGCDSLPLCYDRNAISSVEERKWDLVAETILLKINFRHTARMCRPYDSTTCYVRTLIILSHSAVPLPRCMINDLIDQPKAASSLHEVSDLEGQPWRGCLEPDTVDDSNFSKIWENIFVAIRRPTCARTRSFKVNRIEIGIKYTSVFRQDNRLMGSDLFAACLVTPYRSDFSEMVPCFVCVWNPAAHLCRSDRCMDERT